MKTTFSEPWACRHTPAWSNVARHSLLCLVIDGTRDTVDEGRERVEDTVAWPEEPREVLDDDAVFGGDVHEEAAVGEWLPEL